MAVAEDLSAAAVLLKRAGLRRFTVHLVGKQGPQWLEVTFTMRTGTAHATFTAQFDRGDLYSLALGIPA